MPIVRNSKSHPRIRGLGRWAATAFVLVAPGAAWAVNDNVRSACSSDYFAYCSQHSPNSPGLRACMKSAGPKLSPTCVKALVAAGEVSAAEVKRRADNR